jgi:hypothetical protein
VSRTKSSNPEKEYSDTLLETAQPFPHAKPENNLCVVRGNGKVDSVLQFFIGEIKGYK